MSKIKNALLLDKLLDKWDATNTNPEGNYFQKMVGLAATAGTSPPTTFTFTPNVNNVNDFTKLQEVIKKLYLVFHYPTYEGGTSETKFDSKVADTPKITDDKGVFNYVLPDTTSTTGGGKRLLSSAGIGKKDMINLKMVIDKIAATAATEANVINLLFTEESDDITTSLKMGGNNTTDILPKNTGGKHNKSNKRIKKQPRRRNKSSKSLK